MIRSDQIRSQLSMVVSAKFMSTKCVIIKLSSIEACAAMNHHGSATVAVQNCVPQVTDVSCSQEWAPAYKSCSEVLRSTHSIARNNM